jgi:hypothetical protein
MKPKANAAAAMGGAMGPRDRALAFFDFMLRRPIVIEGDDAFGRAVPAGDPSATSFSASPTKRRSSRNGERRSAVRPPV